MADSKPNTLSEQVENAVERLLELPPDLRVSAILDVVARGLPHYESGLLIEELVATSNRSRQGHVYPEYWFTMADLKRLIPDNCYLVIKIWRLLLTHGLDYNLRIQTEDGRQWESSFAKDAQCSRHARVESSSFLRLVDYLIADLLSPTHFADFDECVPQKLRVFAGHLEQELYHP